MADNQTLITNCNYIKKMYYSSLYLHHLIETYEKSSKKHAESQFQKKYATQPSWKTKNSERTSRNYIINSLDIMHLTKAAITREVHHMKIFFLRK